MNYNPAASERPQITHPCSGGTNCRVLKDPICYVDSNQFVCTNVYFLPVTVYKCHVQ